MTNWKKGCKIVSEIAIKYRKIQELDIDDTKRKAEDINAKDLLNLINDGLYRTTQSAI